MTTSSDSRNPYVSKWSILFDRTIKEWISFKPKLGLQVYPCYACRHIFGSRNSFLDHVNRRSVYIRYNCRICTAQEDLVFYNPCSFLLHARQHFNFYGGCIDLDDLEISALPIGLAGFMPHPEIKMLYDVVDDDAGNLIINTRFYSTSSDCMGHKLIHFTPNEMLLFRSTGPGRPVLSFVLKQISTNIPRCILVEMEHNRLNRPPNFTGIYDGNDDDNNNNRSNFTVMNTDDSNTSFPTSVTVKSECEGETNVCSYPCTMPIITKVETVTETENSEFSELPSKLPDIEQSTYKYPNCPECHRVQRNSMAEHFVKENKPYDGSIQCSVCKYVAPTICSIRAHERIHESLSPFVCPECGKTFDDWKSLHLHLSDVCFHLAKQVRIKCPGKKCGKVFAQTITFSAHFTSTHLQCMNKCTICNAGFFDEQEFLEHSVEHQDSDTPQKIYKCTVCTNEDAFQLSNKEEHIQMHANDRRNFVYVYTCKHCRSYFRSNFTYATHLLRCAKNIVQQSTNLEQKVFENRKFSIGNSPKTLNIIPKVNLNEKDKNIKIHMIITICSRCNVRLKFQVLNLKNMLSNCPKCGEKLYLPVKQLNIQNSEVKKEGIVKEVSKTVYNDSDAENEAHETCILCGLKFTHAYEHKRICKYRNPVVVIEKKWPKTENSREGSVSPKSDDSSKKKRKRYNYTALTNKHKKLLALENFPELQAEEPVPFDGTYNCKLCEFRHEDRAKFHEHIIEHRLILTSYQCMECGECFVVKPSLAKHLQFYHQIFDIESYLKENDCFDKKAVKELEENMKLAPGESKSPVKENQCRVCLQEFENGFELKKHFRVHGMAFLLHNMK